MGDGNSRIGRCCNPSSHPRHHFYPHAMFHEMRCFLTPPTKEERITTFEADHTGVTCRQLHKHSVRARLRDGMVPPALPHEVTFTVLRHKIQNLPRHERVVHKRITGLEQTMRLHCEQLGVSRTSTNEINDSRTVSSSHGKETSKSIKP